MADRMTPDVAAVLVNRLVDGPATYDEMAAHTGISKPRVARWVKNCRSFIYIAGWAPDKNGRPFLPQFRWGAAPDEPRPGRTLTPAEQMRQSRQRRALNQEIKTPKKKSGTSCK